VLGFCEALGIEQPIVYGGSFVGQVALSFATRYPTKLSKLILECTTAKAEIDVILNASERLGGIEARRIAEARWLYPSKETRARYLEVCVPLYTARARIHPDAERRMIRNDGLALHFSGGDGEFLKFDCRADLRRILCSTLAGSQA
jgi:proline iminopeptidase